MTRVMLAIAICVSGCAVESVDATATSSVQTTDPETDFCTYEDGVWTCNDDPPGGGGGGGGPFACVATCDPTWGGQDWYCTTSCGRPAICAAVYRCTCDPWDYSEECLRCHEGYCY